MLSTCNDVLYELRLKTGRDTDSNIKCKLLVILTNIHAAVSEWFQNSTLNNPTQHIKYVKTINLQGFCKRLLNTVLIRFPFQVFLLCSVRLLWQIQCRLFEQENLTFVYME
jgi:hypothetical protein